MIINDDTRNIKLTLSARCYSHLETDCSVADIKMSRLIELIVCDYCDWAEKISRHKEKDRLTQMYNIMTDGGEIRFFKCIAGLLIKSGDDAIKNRHSFARSKTYNWTVTANARQALNNDTLSDSESSNFITDLIEEYTDMNFAAREKIMLRDNVKTIERAIKGTFAIKYRTRNGKEHIMIPYRIISDTDTQYNYLVGILADGGSPENRPRCARVFSMSNISIVRKKYTLNSSEIEEYTEGRDIAYLWEEKELDNILVALTPAGEGMLKLLIHNRPVIMGKEGTDEQGHTIYRIKSTEFQSEIYFERFGKNAKILFPQTIADNIKRFHESALAVYEETTG